MPRRQNTGFSLIELMVVIAIVAVLLTLGLPSFQSSLRSNRIATTSTELLASLALARSEAVRSTRGGGVCSKPQCVFAQYGRSCWRCGEAASDIDHLTRGHDTSSVRARWPVINRYW